MKKKLFTGIVMLSLTAAGCAYRPIIDTRGVDIINYRADLVECQQHGEQIEPAAGAAGGAVVGAIFGALLGRALGDTNAGMKAGAIGGTAGGLGGSVNAQRQVVANCLRGRGYRVLY